MKRILLIICLLCSTLGVKADLQGSSLNDPYMVAFFSSDEMTLYFLAVPGNLSLNLKVGGTFNGHTITKVYYVDEDLHFQEWFDDRDNFAHVVFYPTCDVYTPTTFYNWFSEFKNLKDITGLEYLNTSEVTSMAGMFLGCSKLTSLDLSTFDTSNVTNMNSMFNGCSSLTSIDLSNFESVKMTECAYMFEGCSSLRTIYCKNDWNNIFLKISSTRMFEGCTNLVGAISYDAAKTTLGYANPTTGYFTAEKQAEIIEKKPYAYYIASNKTLYFSYDAFLNYNIADITAIWSGDEVVATGTSDPGWNDYRDQIEHVVFLSTFAEARPTSCYDWFYKFDGLKDITGLQYLNTSNVTDMSSMFHGCSSLTSLDVTNFNTSNVTSMTSMFSGCSSLTSLDVTNFNTSNVTYMGSMFSGCSSLTSLDVTKFNTSNVTSMGSMFYNCSNLTSLDVTKFNTTKVALMSGMFRGCSSLTSLDVTNFNTSNVTNMGMMFYNCSSLTSLDVTNFNTSNVTNMGTMFYNCSSLTSLDVTNFNTSNVTNMGTMFYNCSSLTSLDVTKFNTTKVAQMNSMFSGCSSLTSLDVTNFNTSNVTNMNAMFAGCSSLTSLDLSNFDTSKVGTMLDMFRNCSALKSIYCPKDWSSGFVGSADSSYMFLGCTNLVGAISYDASKTDIYYANPTTGYFTAEKKVAQVLWCKDDNTLYFINSGTNYSEADYYNDQYITAVWSGDDVTATVDIPEWNMYAYDVQHVVFDESFADVRPTSTAWWFFQFEGLEDITGIEYLNTSNVTDMNNMFNSCYSLSSLDVTHFNTENVTDMSCMFEECASLTNLDLWSFDTSNVTTMSWMFSGCETMINLDLSNFNTNNVTDMNGMFNDCRAITSLDLSNFVTGNVTNMRGMFASCEELSNLNVSKFNTGNVTTMAGMFSFCSSLTSLDLSNFNTSNVENMSFMFRNCSGLTSLDLNNFNTSNVTDMNNMFTECRGLTSLDLSNFNTSNVTQMGNMFCYSSGLTTLDLSNFNTEKVTSMSYMFASCTSLKSLNVSNFDTRNVTSMMQMFYNCESLTHLDLTSFQGNSEHETSMYQMFNGCTNLKSIYTNEWSSFNAGTSYYHMFANCPNLVGGYGTKVSDPDNYSYAAHDVPGRPGYFTNILFLDNQAPTDGRVDNATRLDANFGLTPPGGVIFYNRTLYKDGAWNTLCLPFSMTAAQIAASPLAGATITTLAKASVTGGVNGGTLNLSFSEVKAITAGTPYLIKWDSGTGGIIDLYVENNIGAINVTKGNSIICSGAPTLVEVYFSGNLDPVKFTKDDKNRLFMGADNKFYYSNTGNPLGSCRAYIQLSSAGIIDDGPFLPIVKEIVLDFGDGTTTSIRAEELNKSNADTSVYDLQGRRVLYPQKGGMYIVNGKKVIY